jgi:hypothetical protein
MFKKLMVITVIVITSFTMAFGQHNFRFAQKNNKFNVEADFRVSQGLLPLTYDFFDNLGHDCIDMPTPYLPESYRNAQSYTGNKYSTGAINISQSVKVAKWLELGAVLTYAGTFQNIYNTIDNSVVDREMANSFFFTPTMRFAWFNREWVRMYSSVGLGFGVMFQNFAEGRHATGANETNIEWGPSIQLTGFGISLGRKFFWFAEVQSIGTLGLFTMGAGYRFTPKKEWRR